MHVHAETVSLGTKDVDTVVLAFILRNPPAENTCNESAKAVSQKFDLMHALWEVKHIHVSKNRLGFYSHVSCIHMLCHTANQP